MPKKTHKRVKVQTYLAPETMLQCRADAGAMSMTLSEYVAIVIAARFGKANLPAPTKPTQLAARQSRGTGHSLPGIGGMSRVVEGHVEEDDDWAENLARRLRGEKP